MQGLQLYTLGIFKEHGTLYYTQNTSYTDQINLGREEFVVIHKP